MIALKCDPNKLPEPLIPRTKAHVEEIQRNELIEAITAEVFDPYAEDTGFRKDNKQEKEKRKKERISRRIKATRKAHTKFSDEVVREVMRLRSEGKTFPEISKIVGFDPKALGALIYRERRRQGLCESRFTPFTPAQDAVIKQMRAEGKLWREISDELGRSSESIRKHAHKTLGL